ncbi:hypothetical protein JCM19296_2510 [Nonlabens ulvanivorans]|uniref:Uncharacterized protein n=1 Tax=Nonlabens ulvanivorans TaxID=906888 RepID=A0A081DDB4_NONUL|nr:hypothetical protein JCM19296_2510 [Nonlabens ulvanivorans]
MKNDNKSFGLDSIVGVFILVSRTNSRLLLPKIKADFALISKWVLFIVM